MPHTPVIRMCLCMWVCMYVCVCVFPSCLMYKKCEPNIFWYLFPLACKTAADHMCVYTYVWRARLLLITCVCIHMYGVLDCNMSVSFFTCDTLKDMCKSSKWRGSCASKCTLRVVSHSHTQSHPVTLYYLHVTLRNRVYWKSDEARKAERRIIDTRSKRVCQHLVVFRTCFSHHIDPHGDYGQGIKKPCYSMSVRTCLSVTVTVPKNEYDIWRPFSKQYCVWLRWHPKKSIQRMMPRFLVAAACFKLLTLLSMSLHRDRDRVTVHGHGHGHGLGIASLTISRHMFPRHWAEWLSLTVPDDWQWLNPIGKSNWVTDDLKCHARQIQTFIRNPEKTRKY